MPDYVFSTRDVSDDTFVNEPGRTRFLRVPGRQIPKPKHEIGREEWVERLVSDACNGMDPVIQQPIGEILVFVHGYSTSPSEMINRHRQLQQVLEAVGFAGVVVSFDWPSANIALNYLEDRVDAKLSAFNLVSDGIALMLATQTEACRIQVNLLGYSMGAYVIREAFDDADDRPRLARRNWMVHQICLLAADVSSTSLLAGNPKSASLYRHALRVTNYYSPFDALLKLSNAKRAGVAPRAGRVGLPPLLPAKAVDVNCGLYFSAFHEQIIHEQDEGMRGIPSHSWYFYSQLFAQDLYYTLLGNIEPGWLPTRIRLGDGTLALWPPGEPPPLSNPLFNPAVAGKIALPQK